MDNLLIKQQEEIENLKNLIEYKNNEIRSLKSQIHGGKNIEESLKFLIYKYNLRPGSRYFERERIPNNESVNKTM